MDTTLVLESRVASEDESELSMQPTSIKETKGLEVDPLMESMQLQFDQHNSRINENPVARFMRLGKQWLRDIAMLFYATM